MAATRVLIVDDEPLARLRLRTLVAELPPELAVVVAEAGDADAALAALAATAVDLVLLDIGLPGRDGLRLAAAMKARPSPPVVVFVTAHAGHALDAFELDAVDYLIKPVRRERLQEALRRAQQRQAARPRGPQQRPANEPVLVVSERGRLLRLPHADLLYLRAEHKSVVLRTASASYVIDGSLHEFEQRLGAGFIRVHRNAIVAAAAIRALELHEDLADEPGAEGWAVRVAPVDEWLAVSRRQVAAVRAALSAPSPPAA